MAATAVSLLEPPHLALLRSAKPGTHAILWGDDSEDSDAAIGAFVNGAVERNDMVMVVLPRKELADLGERLRARGIDLEALVDEGHLFRTVTEDVMPRRPEDVERIPRDMAAILEFAHTVGKDGLTVVGRLAPLFFNRGDQPMAALLERAAQENREGTRRLCVYDRKNLGPERLADAVSLTRLHTDALTAVGGGRFLIEDTNGPASHTSGARAAELPGE